MFTRDHARRLLEAMLSDKPAFVAANQAADRLMMSDEATAEAMAFVAEDSSPPTHDKRKAAIAPLELSTSLSNVSKRGIRANVVPAQRSVRMGQGSPSFKRHCERSEAIQSRTGL